MSHDTHNKHPEENKTIISFKNSFWLVVIIVGLFIAALNFVKAESGSDEKEGKEATEMKAGGESAGEKSEQKAKEAPKPAAQDDAPKSEK